MIQAIHRIGYDLKDSPGLLTPGNLVLVEHGKSTRRLVVIDQGICQWYLQPVTEYFKSVEIEAHIVVINATEDKKNLDTLLILLREMETFGILRRDEPVIAIGGGVLLDIVGFAASLYRRGIPYIRVPTTLVGQVDASVGIKVGINFEGRRNRLGSYYPPLASYLDPIFLQTLPSLEISSGLGEILKIAVIKDWELFDLLEQYGEELLNSKFSIPVIASTVIFLATAGMLNSLEDDLWEKKLARDVDFGHSFSPIIEMRSLQSDQPLTHGQAVALDVIFSSIIAYRRAWLQRSVLIRIVTTAIKMGLPSGHPLFEDPLILLEALNDTTKHRNGKQNLPIPGGIGTTVFLNDVTFSEIKSTVALLKELNACWL